VTTIKTVKEERGTQPRHAFYHLCLLQIWNLQIWIISFFNRIFPGFGARSAATIVADQVNHDDVTHREWYSSRQGSRVTTTSSLEKWEINFTEKCIWTVPDEHVTPEKIVAARNCVVSAGLVGQLHCMTVVYPYNKTLCLAVYLGVMQPTVHGPACIVCV
jgi:hypothetical protein